MTNTEKNIAIKPKFKPCSRGNFLDKLNFLLDKGGIALLKV